MKTADIKKLSLEETFEKIEDVMAALQDEDVALEESFTLYKEGMEMLSHCKEVIDTVEKKVIELSGDQEEE